MSDQALRHAIRRYLPAELRAMVVTGPDVEAEGLSAYTRDDLVKIANDKWNATYDPTSMGRLLRQLGCRGRRRGRATRRKTPAAIEALKKRPERSAGNRQHTS